MVTSTPPQPFSAAPFSTPPTSFTTQPSHGQVEKSCNTLYNNYNSKGATVAQQRVMLQASQSPVHQQILMQHQHLNQPPQESETEEGMRKRGFSEMSARTQNQQPHLQVTRGASQPQIGHDGQRAMGGGTLKASGAGRGTRAVSPRGDNPPVGGMESSSFPFPYEYDGMSTGLGSTLPEVDMPGTIRAEVRFVISDCTNSPVTCTSLIDCHAKHLERTSTFLFQ